MAADESDVSQFSHVFAYDWEADEEFQDGLRAILDPNASPQQAADLTLQAKCFYYSRYVQKEEEKKEEGISDSALWCYISHWIYGRKFNVAIEPGAYQSWVRRLSNIEHIPTETGNKPVSSFVNTSDGAPLASAPASAAEPAAPYPTSFGQIVELITQGKPIPGVREVPHTLLTGQESQPTLAKRKKPWEQQRGEEAASGSESKNHITAV